MAIEGLKKGKKTVFDYLMNGGVEGVVFVTYADSLYVIKGFKREDIEPTDDNSEHRSITTITTRFRPYKSKNYRESKDWEEHEDDLAFRLHDSEVIFDERIHGRKK